MALARSEFRNLSEPEEELLKKAQRGEMSILAKPGNVDSGEAEESKQARRIRSEVLRWLCTNPQASVKVDARGIKVFGAFMDGALDLSYTNISFALEFEECDFPDGLDLKSARLARLSLSGSRVSNIWATNLVTLGDVSLNSHSGSNHTVNFRSTGLVNFDRCKIGGDLNCSGGLFLNPGKTSLSMASGKVDGSILLTRFAVEGRVEVGSASVGGDFICSEGTIACFEEDNTEAADEEPPPPENPHNNRQGLASILSKIRVLLSFFKKTERVHEQQTVNVTKDDLPKHLSANRPRFALEASQLKIGGSAFLREGLEISGGANMIGANIASDLDCSRARFLNPGKVTFLADRIKIGSDAFFANFETDGLIVLSSASIEGNLNFNSVRFLGEARSGVILEVASVKRTLVWRNIEKTPRMVLRLDDASVGRFLDDEPSSPAEDRLSLFGFRYNRISGVKTAKLRINWVQLAEKGASLQPYEQLASVLKEAGHETAAKQVAIARENARRKHSGMSWWVKAWKYFLKLTVGYGYAPSRAVYWGIGMILLGWLLFGAAYQKSLFSPIADGIYRDQNYLTTGRTLPNGYQTFNALVYSLDSFLPIIDLHQESKWLPNPTQNCIVLGREVAGGWLIRLYLWIHIIAGWALTSLAVVGFTGVIRKE
jgi:hypothetical protein